MRKKNIETLAVPMSSMIDVVFQLLIYFIVTQREEVTEAHLAVNLPAPGAAKASENKPKMLELEVHPGALLIQGAQREVSEIGDMLVAFGQRDKDMTVMVKVAMDSFATDLVTALDLCDKAGLKNLNVVTLR
ncbi:MAG: biopolymer transporter ExbD [Victivallales bacterium]|nr:biopolymer transporter ExbD [Victivallales bacterium]